MLGSACMVAGVSQDRTAVCRTVAEGLVLWFRRPRHLKRVESTELADVATYLAAGVSQFC